MGLRILVVGAGAVGGYFGARLVAAGRDVTFLVRARRASEIRRDGLRIASPNGDLTVSPRLVTASELDRPFDLILMSVKGFGLEAAMADVAGAVGPDTVILPLLNGMRHMDELDRRFGSGAVMGGLCLVMTEIEADGRIVQFSPMQQITFGERDGAMSPRVGAIGEALGGAGFTAQASPAILQAMWEKWLMLSSLGAACCLLRGSIGEIAAVPHGRETLRAVLDECSAIADACGFPPSAPFLARHTAAMTAANSPLTTSMYRDLRKGAAVEVDAILGDLLRRGIEAGVSTPLLQAAVVNLGVYAAGRARPA